MQFFRRGAIQRAIGTAAAKRLGSEIPTPGGMDGDELTRQPCRSEPGRYCVANTRGDGGHCAHTANWHTERQRQTLGGRQAHPQAGIAPRPAHDRDARNFGAANHFLDRRKQQTLVVLRAVAGDGAEDVAVLGESEGEIRRSGVDTEDTRHAAVMPRSGRARSFEKLHEFGAARSSWEESQLSLPFDIAIA